MTDKKLLRKIKGLKNISPEPNWLSSKRQDLINHIAEDEKEFRTLDSFFGWFWYHRLQPGILAVCMLLIVGAGPLLTVKAAQSSLPGDFLYGIKKTTERVQMSITSEDNKAQIQVDFASRRLEELEKITATTDETEEKTIKTKEVISDLKENIAQASQSVKNTSKEQVALIAKKTQKIKEDLDKVKEEINEDAQEVVAEAKQAVEDANEMIMAILIDVEEDIASTTEDIIEEVKEEIEEKTDIEFITGDEEIENLQTDDMMHETTTEDILE